MQIAAYIPRRCARRTRASQLLGSGNARQIESHSVVLFARGCIARCGYELRAYSREKRARRLRAKERRACVSVRMRKRFCRQRRRTGFRTELEGSRNRRRENVFDLKAACPRLERVA